MLELLLGRRMSIDTLSSQPAKQIVYQSLVYDSELEKEYIDNPPSSKGKKEGNIIIIDKPNLCDIAFNAKYPELRDAVVTLLPERKYLEIESKNHN